MPRRYFENARVVGVEGLIVSDRVNDPDYRAVTNVGFEGIGFMTANLLLRRDVFNAIDGFDEQFDVPFREDTDLGWRACALGEIPFGHDVRVFHPPHPRTVEREALAQRVRFFEKDALLLKKHPDRYRTLFLKEGHYLNTEGFHEHFRRGAVKYRREDRRIPFRVVGWRHSMSEQPQHEQIEWLVNGFRTLLESYAARRSR